MLMDFVHIKVFGTPEIWVNQRKIEMPFKKAEGIVYYLATEKKTTRDTLVNLFWCDVQDDIAKKNLRNAFYMIRKTMGLDLFSMPNRSFVELTNAITLTIDFDTCRSGEVETLPGEFLEGFIVKDAENFDIWAVQTREQLKEEYIGRLYDLIQQSDDERLIKEYCKRVLNYDEFDEAMYRRLMRVYLNQGRFNKAIELYKQLEKLLKNELGITPDQHSVALYEEILLMKNQISKEVKSSTAKSRFYGRKDEMERLAYNHQGLDSETAKSLLLIGDAGIGKTALVEQFTKTLQKDVLVLRVSCFQAEERFNLRPWDAVVRQLVKQLPGLPDVVIPPQMRRLLSPVFPSLMEIEGETYEETDEKLDFIMHQILDKALYELFDLVAVHHTIVFVFEDIHWIDALSLSLIKQFILNENNKRFYMLLTARYAGLDQSQRAFKELIRYNCLEEMPIRGFTRQETFEVLKPYMELGKLTPLQVDAVFNDTEGNALFLFEFANSLMDGLGVAELSSKIRDVLNSRILPLFDEARKVLNIISVFFDYASLDDLIATSEMSELQLADILEVLIQQRLIREINETGPELSFQFTHQKLREFVYNELSFAKKRILSRRIGQLLEMKLGQKDKDKAQYSKLIYYFNQSGDKLHELKYRLAYLHDYLQVTHETFPIVYYMETASMLTIPLSEADVLKELQTIEALFDQIVVPTNQLALLYDLRMEFSHIMGRYWIKSGEFEKGLEAIDTLMALALSVGHTPYCLKGYMQRIFYTINAHKLDEMKQHLDEALARSEGYPLEHHVYMRLKGHYKILVGQFDKGEKLIQTALEYFEEINKHGEYTLNIAACHFYLGESQRLQRHFDPAIRHFENAIALCKSKNLVGRLTIFYTHAGHAAYDALDYQQAQKFLEEATILYKTYDFRWGRSTACGFLGLLELMDGYYKGALELFKSAEAYALRLNNTYEQGILRRIKAEACLYLIKNRVRYVPILDHIGLDLAAYCDLSTLTYHEEDIGFKRDVVAKLEELSQVLD